MGRWLGTCLVLAVADVACGGTLPVFMADNHAETFGWIVRTFDPDQPLTLVLVDAHSDASAAKDSDALREGCRRAASAGERDRRIGEWRNDGRIQAFNWIEPLMPRPLDHVVWVADLKTGADKRAELAWDAVQALDGRLETEPRGAGSFAARWTVEDVDGLRKWKPGKAAVILSIDLDFLTGRTDAEKIFEGIWESAMAWPGLAGVSFSISRPWLASDAEADRLAKMALGAVARTRGAELEWDIAVDGRPDNSLKADSVRKLGGTVPRWDIRKADPWFGAMSDAGKELAGTIAVDGADAGCDGVVRLDDPAGAVLRVKPGARANAGGRVKWFARVPAMAAYDLSPETGLGKSFSQTPGRWIYERRIDLGETPDFALAPGAWTRLLDHRWHCGRVVIEAEYEADGHWLPVAAADIRVRAGEGFHGALGECFGMPYVFGIALQQDGGSLGVDTGWGSDCSNLLAHAWRKSGVRAPWGDPGMLRRGLSTLAERATPDSGVKIDAAAIRRGVALDFGTHVAALWEDRDPLGTLDGGDLAVHHLGGFPEVRSVRDLARGREPFAVRTVPGTQVCRLGLAGDVVLAEESGGMEELAAGLAGCDLGLANLEGIPSDHQPDHPVKYDFRFSADRLAALRKCGVKVVSLANNHAADAGLAGLAEGRRAVEAASLGVVGAGANLDEAARPWLGEANGLRLAVFGVCLADAPAAGAAKAGILKLPEHEAELGQRLAGALADRRVPVVMVHWGDEHVRSPNAEQRQWGRWLAERGVAVVAGSGPHVVQPVEFHAGAGIAHSLGNAVYPTRLAGGGSGMVWRVGMGPGGELLGADSGLHLDK